MTSRLRVAAVAGLLAAAVSAGVTGPTVGAPAGADAFTVAAHAGH